jgi:hypothetical protein
MEPVGFALIAVVAAAVCIVAIALVELYRDLEHLRQMVGAVDEPRTVNMVETIHTQPSEHGLPPALDGWESGAVILLADICGTCALLAAELSGRVPPNVHICLSARAEEDGLSWLDSTGMAEDRSSVTIDAGDRISTSMGIRTAPSFIRITQGRLAGARTIPSVRWLAPLLTEVRPTSGHAAGP